MGQNSSKKHKKLKTRPECTEIIDLEFSSEDITGKKTPNPGNKFVAIIEKLNDLQRNIETMSDTEINLYYATFKDDLLNNWTNVFSMQTPDGDDNGDVKRKKIEVIERIKRMRRDLDERYFNRR